MTRPDTRRSKRREERAARRSGRHSREERRAGSAPDASDVSDARTPSRPEEVPLTPAPPPLPRVAARPLRVVVVDDHPLVRDGLSCLLELTDGVTIAGRAGDALQALRVIDASAPDLAVIDANLPGTSGAELIEQLKARWPALTVVGMSAHGDPGTEAQLRAAGADAFAYKGGAPDEVVDQILAAARGK